MTYAQINHETGEILNIINAESGFLFSTDYDWQPTDNFNVSAGDFYINGQFYENDKTTEIVANDMLEILRQENFDLKVISANHNTEITKSMLATADLAKTSSDKYTKLELAIADLAKVFFGGKK